MPIELKIRWDGDVQGVTEHRLSLAKFGAALNELVHSLQRTATQMVGNAVEGPDVGRFADLARRLDIQITEIKGESVGFNAVVSFLQPEDELPLFADLADRAVTDLLDSIERESKGLLGSTSARRFLKTLPSGIRKQIYDLHEKGTRKRHIEIADVHFQDIPAALPSLREVTGNVVGVGFQPGKSEVRVKGESTIIPFDATPQEVDETLNIRRGKVRVLGVYDGKKNRLLKMAQASRPRFRITDEAIEEHIFKRWNGVFARLAK